MGKFLTDLSSFCDRDGVNFMNFETNSLDFSRMKNDKCFQVRCNVTHLTLIYVTQPVNFIIKISHPHLEINLPSGWSLI